MNRQSLLLLVALTLATACTRKAEDAGDAPNAANVDSIPKTPMVNVVQVGMAFDSGGARIPQMVETFRPTDTIRVSIGTSHTGMGSKVTVNLMLGETQVATAEGILPAIGADDHAWVGLVFPPAKPWAPGEYHVMALLDGKPQVGAVIHVAKP